MNKMFFQKDNSYLNKIKKKNILTILKQFFQKRNLFIQKRHLYMKK